MKKFILFFISIIVLSIFISGNSGATTNRFNIMRFYPNPDAGAFSHIWDSQTLYQYQFTVGMGSSYGYEPLKWKNISRKVVDNLWEDHVYGAVGFTDWFEMAVDMPIAFWNNFTDPNPAVPPPSKWELNVGDMWVGFKGRILDRYEKPVGLAIAPFVTIPTGKETYFLGEGNVSGGADVVLDAQLGKRVVLALNTGVEVGEKVQIRNVDRGKIQVRLGAGANIRATENLSISAEGFVRTATNHLFSNREVTPAEAVVGAHYKFGDSGLMLNVGGGAGIVSGVGAPLARAFASLTYKHMNDKFRARDRERDPWYRTAVDLSAAQMMLVELREKCPPQENFRPGIDDERCPKYYELQDMAELIIKCPSRPEDFNPLKHDERCQKVYTMPEFYSQKEMSVVYLMAANEMSLRCPASPDLYKEGVHDPACPKYYDLVELTGLIGKCPKNPEDFQPGVHDDRCNKVYELKSQYPEATWNTIVTLADRDSDHDGVPDLLDRCPDQKGEANRRGCPAGEAFVEGELLKTAQPLEFPFNSSNLKPEMMPVIADVAAALTANPNLRISVEGYADSVGEMWANVWISEMRAKKVRDALYEMGVSDGRISISGKGATSRFGDNLTEEGRRQNRRVVFVVIAK